MGDHHQPAGEPGQPLLQPGDHLRVQMVGGLVQNQHVGGVDEHRGQRHALALSAGQLADLPVEVGDAQLCEDRLGLIFVDLAEFRRVAGKHLLQHGQPVVQRRRLRKV